MTVLNLDSRKHGIDAAQLAIHPDEAHEFNQLLDGLYTDIRPTGETQRILFGQILHAAWNMRIARKHEAQALLKYGPSSTSVQSTMRFYQPNERTFYRAMTELRNLQTELAYRATLARQEDAALPDVPPLVRTAQVHKQVRQAAAEPILRRPGKLRLKRHAGSSKKPQISADLRASARNLQYKAQQAAAKRNLSDLSGSQRLRAEFATQSAANLAKKDLSDLSRSPRLCAEFAHKAQQTAAQKISAISADLRASARNLQHKPQQTAAPKKPQRSQRISAPLRGICNTKRSKPRPKKTSAISADLRASARNLQHTSAHWIAERSRQNPPPASSAV